MAGNRALSKEISFKKKGKLPTKRTINLADSTKPKGINWAIAIPLIIVIIALAVLFAKFAVVDQFAKLSKLQSENSEIQRNIDKMYEEIAKFDEVKSEYAHYTFSGFTEEELSRADRNGVLDLIDKYVMPSAVLDSWTLYGNTLVMMVSGITLGEANSIVANLETDPTISFCSVQTASMDNGASEFVTAKITAYLTAEVPAEGGTK